VVELFNVSARASMIGGSDSVRSFKQGYPRAAAKGYYSRCRQERVTGEIVRQRDDEEMAGGIHGESAEAGKEMPVGGQWRNGRA